MKKIGLLAAMSAMLGIQAGASMNAQVQKFQGYRAPLGRSRTPGKRGNAGEKLARMAKEGRLTLRKGW
jgi:hypothetical protein